MDICELLLDTISEFYEKDSRTRTFGTGTELSHSEIHTLQCIAENPGLHISGIARLLGVTRGAVSQAAKRLERKEMIVKETSSRSSKKVLLRLTDKGKIAVANHRRAHERYHAVVSDILAGASNEQLRFLSEFLSAFERNLKKQA